MGDVQSILPATNSTPWEKAVEQTSAERWEALDVDVIRRARDPWLCPEHLLPQLAYQRSVDIWDESWPVEKKRQVIADAPEDHHLKTTEEGLARYLRHAGAALVRATVPPSKTFLGAALTEAERRKWVERFPQLRIFPFIAGETIRFKTFTNVAGGRERAFLGKVYPYDAEARDRYRRSAFLFEPRDGSLTSVEHRTIKHVRRTGEAVDVQQILLPAIVSTAIYLGDSPRAHRYFGRTGVAERVVTIKTPLTYGYTVVQAQNITIPPSLNPIDVRPVMRFETGAATFGSVFADIPRGRSFLPPSRAWRRVYEVIYLHDPERLPLGGPRTTHIRGARLGYPVKTAMARAKIRSRRNRRGVSRFVGGYFLPLDHRHLWNSVDAARSSKALSTVVLLATKSVRKPRVGDRIPVGSIRVGDFIPA